MPQPTLQGLPQELITDILEYVCEQIVKDLTGLRFNSKTPCHKLLHPFVNLHLVSRTFHAVLTHYVRVEGLPVRKRLLDLQMGKFMNLVKTSSTFARDDFLGCEVSPVLKHCGHVWKNPRLVKIFPQLFVQSSILEPAAARFFLSWGPELFKDLLVETKNDGEDPESTNFHLSNLSNSQVEVQQSTYRNKPFYDRVFANLALKNRYRFDTPGWERSRIEFVVGRKKFPYIFLAGRSGFWIGTSVLSFKYKGLRRDNDIYGIGETTLNETVGRYWLWFIPSYRYLLIDFETLTFIDSEVCDLVFEMANYGRFHLVS